MQGDESTGGGMRGKYQRRMLKIRGAFEADASGSATISARSAALDELVRGLWQQAVEQDGRVAEKDVKDAIRRVNEEMWDCRIRVSPATRKIAECERLAGENVEFTVSLMDHRLITGDAALYDKLAVQALPKLLQREQKAMEARLVELTRIRHAKYGDTLFHLEPNIKDCPGGLRDVHVCEWLTALQGLGSQEKKNSDGAAAV